MTADLYLTPRTTGTVYGLFASDEPIHLRYVGQTNGALEIRLRSHIDSKSGRRSCIGPWIAEVQSRGAKVGMRILGEYAMQSLTSAEYQWIAFWSHSCDLLNAHLPYGVEHQTRLNRIAERRKHSLYGQLNGSTAVKGR